MLAVVVAGWQERPKRCLSIVDRVMLMATFVRVVMAKRTDELDRQSG